MTGHIPAQQRIVLLQQTSARLEALEAELATLGNEQKPAKMGALNTELEAVRGEICTIQRGVARPGESGPSGSVELSAAERTELEQLRAYKRSSSTQIQKLEQEVESLKASRAKDKALLAQQKQAEGGGESKVQRQLESEMSTLREAMARRTADEHEQLHLQKEMVQSGLWATPVNSHTITEMTGSDDTLTSMAPGLEKVREFEARLHSAASSTELVSLVLQEIQKVKVDITMGLAQQLHDALQHTKRDQIQLRELEGKNDELERMLGQKKLKAVALIKRRVARFLLHYRVKALANHHGGLKKRIADCNTRQHVLLEVVTVEERFLEDLTHLETGFLEPIREQFIAQEVGTELDPHGWVLQMFETFMDAVKGIREGHAKGLPALKRSITSNKGDDDRLSQVCKFFSIVEETLLPLVKYMNRMSAVMKMLADRRNVKAASDKGKKVKDFIWKLQHQLPGEAAKLTLESYIFGVLQNSVSSHALLSRLRKLTPEEHVSMPKLVKATTIIDGMNTSADSKSAEFTELLKMQESLYEPTANFVDESRCLLYQGCTHTIGRVANSETKDFQSVADVEALLADAATSSRIEEECHVFLLSDMLLMCQPLELEVPNPRYRRKGKAPATIKTWKFSVRRKLMRSKNGSCRIAAHADCLFSIVSAAQGVFLFKAASEAEQQRLVKQFQLAWEGVAQGEGDP